MMAAESEGDAYATRAANSRAANGDDLKRHDETPKTTLEGMYCVL
jgi:hypothetical protein